MIIINTAMVIGSDYQPLGNTRLSRALTLVRAKRAEVIRDRGVYRSVALTFRIPTIIRLFAPVNFGGRKVALSPKNVFARDNHTCQYCGVIGGRLTLDHVHPRSKGGPHTWENLVTSCFDCNQRKRDRSPAAAGMRLRREPKEASLRQVLRVTADGRDWLEMIMTGTFSVGDEVAAE